MVPTAAIASGAAVNGITTTTIEIASVIANISVEDNRCGASVTGGVFLSILRINVAWIAAKRIEWCSN